MSSSDARRGRMTPLVLVLFAAVISGCSRPCEDIPEEKCGKHSAKRCSKIAASRYKEELGCYSEPEFVACAPTESCPKTVVAEDVDGQRWIFWGSCIPDEWTPSDDVELPSQTPVCR